MPGYEQGASHSTALQMQTTSTHYRSGVWKTITPKMKSKLVIRDVKLEDGWSKAIMVICASAPPRSKNDMHKITKIPRINH